MKKKDIFIGIVLVLLFTFNYYLNGIFGLLNGIVLLGVYIIIFYTLHILWRKLRKIDILDFYVFLRKFLYSVSLIITILFVILGSFTVYFNKISPATMPEYTLTNGEKTIKFQGMIHIGRQGYYDEIIQNLINFKEQGGVYFFEGVRPGTEENMDKFNQALGIEFDDSLYDNFAKLYGVTFQDTGEFLGLVNDLDFNVDISIDEIVNLYDEKTNGIPQKEKTYSMPIDANAEILRILSGVNERELKLLIFYNQAILNFFMKNDSILESLSNSFADEHLFEVILDERNKVLVDAIYDYEYDNIFITYGLLHFKGFFELLKEKDDNWEIIEIKNLYPISKK